MNRLTPLLYALTLLFLLWSGWSLITSCTGFHPLRAQDQLGHTYKAPHTILGNHAKSRTHFFWKELTSTDSLAVEKSFADTLAEYGYTTAQVIWKAPPSRQYNSHGLSFDRRHSFISGKYVPDICIHENIRSVRICPDTSVRIGDIAIYSLNEKIVHSGVVSRIKDTTIWVISKWGSGPEYEHQLTAVPDSFGLPEFFRKCN